MSEARPTVDWVYRASGMNRAGLAHPSLRGADAAPTWLPRVCHGGDGDEVGDDVDGGEGGGAREPTAR